MEPMILRGFRPDEVQHALARRQITDAAQMKRVRARFEQSGALVDGYLDLAAVVGDRIIGEMQARAQWAQGLPDGVFEIGIEIYEEQDRGHGLGTEMLRLMMRLLFETHGADRLQLSTWVENIAMRRSAEKLGFRLEGIMRAFMPSPRGRDDYALYATTADDPLPTF